VKAGVLDRVLTIEEVKQKMKEIRTAAVHYGGVVHCGERGRDELVIVSARTWEEVTARQQGERALAGSSSDPYAAFDRALEEGRLGGVSESPEPRRRIQGLRSESGLPVSQMVSLGMEKEPRRRRRAE